MIAAKYAAIITIMGSKPSGNHRTKTGRSLQWFSKSSGMSLDSRRVYEGDLMIRLTKAGVECVQRVSIRQLKTEPNSISDYDKITIYVT